jgi:hypothetical protein
MKNLAFSLAFLTMAATFGRAQVEADPNKDYAITPDAGAWFICATSYVGPQSSQLAHEMILEIRSRFKLPAYVLNRGDEQKHKQEEELQRYKQQYDELNRLRKQYNQPEVSVPHRLMPHVQEQCAVLVGGYRDQDSAYAALKDFKKLPPPSNERLCPILTQIGPAEKSGTEQKAMVQYAYANPFVNAFVVPNPSIPRQAKSQEKPNDPFLKKLNAHEQYSLLKCKKPYTLMISVQKGLHTFQGANPGNDGFFEKLWGNNSGDLLDASAQNAHNLADTLRKMPGGGLEAYVLHMREGSIVTVGGFDRADDPQIKGFQEALATRLKAGQGVQMLPQPLVIQVPRP